MHVAVRGHRRRQRREPHEVGAFGDDALARLDAFGDLHQVAASRSERDRPPLERLAFALHEHDRPAGIVHDRGRGNDRPRRRGRPSADGGTPPARPASPSVRLSNANVIGSVRDCGSSTLPDADQAACRHAIGWPGDFDFGGLREPGARRVRFWNLTDDVHLRRRRRRGTARGRR